MKPGPSRAGSLHRKEKAGAVYVGDSEVDVATARAAGVEEAAVTWGFRSRETLLAAGARTLIDTPSQLAALADQN